MGFPISDFSRAGMNGFLFTGFPISLERWFPISKVSYFAQFPISCSSAIPLRVPVRYYLLVLVLVLCCRYYYVLLVVVLHV